MPRPFPRRPKRRRGATTDNPGHPTFRIRDKIYVIMAVDGSGGSIRTSMAEQSDLTERLPRRRAAGGVCRTLRLGRRRLRRRPGRGAARGPGVRVGADGAEEGRPGLAGRAMTAAALPHPGSTRTGTNDTARRPPDRGGLRQGPRRGARRADPVRRRRLPRRRHEPRDRAGRGRRRRGHPRSRAAVQRPARRWRHAPARIPGRDQGRRHARGLPPPHRTHRRRPAGPAARADGLRQPGHRRRGRRSGRAPPGRCRRGRADRRGPDARRGRALRGRRARGRPGGRLPRRPDHAQGRGAPRSPPGAAASSIASRWSA